MELLLAKPRPLFYFLGDSITQYGSYIGTCGWIAQMQEHYVRSVDMENRGLGGWNTRFVFLCLLLLMADLMRS